VISSVTIKNLRGIREGALEGLTALTVLVGPNSSGKSTILDALLIGAAPDSAKAIAHVVRRRGAVQRGKRWLFWRGQEQAPAIVGVKTRGGAERRSTIGSSEQSPRIFRVIVAAETGTGSADFELADDNTIERRLGSSPPKLDDLADVRLVEPQGGGHAPLLHRVFTRAREAGRTREVDALLRDLLPGLERVEILTDSANKPVVYLSYEDHSVPSGLAGDGVQSLLRLGLELAAAPGGVVLVEEPEAHEHPGAMRQSAKAIVAAVRRGVQVILTTHSLELIDALLATLKADEIDLLSLYRLKLVDGELRQSRFDGEDVSTSRGDIEDDLR
jgi:hypothetical protein